MRRPRISRFTIALGGVIVLGGALLVPNLKVLVEQRQELAQLRDQVEASEEHVAELQSETSRWNDPAYIRAQTRERLYFVLPGEQPFIVIDDVDDDEPAEYAQVNEPTAEVQRTNYVWSDQLLQSVIEAGIAETSENEGDGS